MQSRERESTQQTDNSTQPVSRAESIQLTTQMAVLKPCVPYCFFLLPLATAQFFLLLSLILHQVLAKYLLKFFLPVTDICSYEMTTKNIKIANDMYVI